MRITRLAAALGLATAACGGGDSSAPEETVASVALSLDATTINVREVRQIDVAFHDGTGRTLTGVKNVTWSSSDATTITVDQAGSIRGVKAGGPVTITATEGGVSGSLSLTVVPTISVSATALVAVDSTAQITANYVDFLGAVIAAAPATWTTSNASIVRVDATGTITGVGAGDATVTATILGHAYPVSVEAGVATLFDGTWTGAPYSPTGSLAGTRATIAVRFGAVRGLSMPVMLTAIVASAGSTSIQTCTAQVAFEGRALPTGNAYSFTASNGAVVTGQFVDAHSMTVTLPAMSFAAGTYSCDAPPSSGTRNAPAAVMTAVK